ncbi:hypothetical protein [Capnocytophaga cynodegmi]|uniref:Uncharacterized protein n=1 Tax=Capnocytophaga cynodegmi TaxID=28189 RepID=A0A0B7H4C5_9FLAO|nr:hypothetical protein [Capnocytophaga cynodegmi]CEN32488.1 exported hypothetical protein [Capnocytophaga cynodegmi]
MIIKKALLGLLFGSFNRSVVGVFAYVKSVDFLIFFDSSGFDLDYYFAEIRKAYRKCLTTQIGNNYGRKH